jgi:hypothetical protein
MLTGSMAANFYAVPRMTRDIDLVMELSERDVDRVTRLFQAEYYIDRDMVQRAVRDHAMFNMIHNALVVKVDCVVRKETEGLGQGEPVPGATRRCPESAQVRAGTRHRVSESVGKSNRSDRAVSRGTSMKDTPPEMDARYRAMLMQRSGEERLTMGCAMRETARALVEASILEQDPQATPEVVRRGLFLRFYGHEFDADSREKILDAIESASHPVSK